MGLNLDCDTRYDFLSAMLFFLFTLLYIDVYVFLDEVHILEKKSVSMTVDSKVCLDWKNRGITTWYELSLLN